MTHDFQNRSGQRAGILNFSIPGNFEEDMPAIADWFAEHREWVGSSWRYVSFAKPSVSLRENARSVSVWMPSAPVAYNSGAGAPSPAALP